MRSFRDQFDDGSEFFGRFGNDHEGRKPWWSWKEEGGEKEEPGLVETAGATVGAGNHFSVFLDPETNTLYATGENVVAQLGIGVEGFDVKTPVAVELPEDFSGNIVAVSAGLTHTTFLADTGDVYSFGFGIRGVLGHGDTENRTVATRIESEFDGETVTAIENGNGVSYAITEEGSLFAWGNNANGQLGLGDQEERLVPTKVAALADESIIDVSSGTSHTLVLTEDGEVYGFGSARDGKLGSPDALDEDGNPLTRVLEPVLVAGLPSGVASITADTNTSFAITSDGRVFGWGEDRFGQLLQGVDNGDGTFIPSGEDVLEPIELTALPDDIVDIKAGARWVAALTADGDVYMWGPNDEGPAGGLDGDPDAESNVNFYPTRIAELDDVKVVEIQTGPNSIIAVADNGEIYTWGSNSDGRLGFESDGPVYFPTLIDPTGDAAPFLVSAAPADNERDVGNDAALELNFTEEVFAGEGAVRLVNRDTGQVVEIDINDDRLVELDGSTVTVTPPSHLEAGARYAVEIDDGALVDATGNAYSGIEAGDSSTFNFAISDTEAESAQSYKGSFRADLLRGGSGDDEIKGRWGDDILSGNGGDDTIKGGFGSDQLLGNDGDDELKGGFGHDTLRGGAGDDVLNGGWGHDLLHGDEGGDILRGGSGSDRLHGGEGDDVLTGGWGQDVFVFDGGNDVISDFSTGIGRWWSPPADTIEIDLDEIATFDALIAAANQEDKNIVFNTGEDESLTLLNTDLADLTGDMFSFV